MVAATRASGRQLAAGGFHFILACAAAAIGAFVATHHPLWTQALTAAFAVWCLLACCFPGLWLFVVPTLLPLAGFAPWTGWIGVEEFDLVVLGAAAGGHARLAADRSGWRGAGGELRRRPLPTSWRAPLVCLALFFAVQAASFWRGLNAAGGLPLDWFDGYEDPLNTLRCGKSLCFVLLLLQPLLDQRRRLPALTERRLARGLASGLAAVGVAVVWERAGYPGLLDFSTPYRTTALFWEMHVGGAALDAFLVLSVPFSVYMVAHAERAVTWLIAATLSVLTGYVCLTTFSRGVYLGVLIGLATLFVLRRLLRRGSQESVIAGGAAAAVGLPAAHRAGGDGVRGAAGTIEAMAPRLAATAVDAKGKGGVASRLGEPHGAWRRWANRLLIGMLLAEVLAVFVLGDFLGRRLQAGPQDLGGRLEHWREGLRLLRDPEEWLLGRGLGRFPAAYAAAVPRREMPGWLQFPNDGEARFLRFSGARLNAQLQGTFQLLQRVPRSVAAPYTVRFRVRADRPAGLRAAVCEQHLLYARSCTGSGVRIPSRHAGWLEVVLVLKSDEEYAALDALRPLRFFSLRVDGLSAAIELHGVSLHDGDGEELLRNGSFRDGGAHWFFASDGYFVPWHVDSLFLETLIAQGMAGLLLLLALLALAANNLQWSVRRGDRLAPYLLAALLSASALGLVSSLFDMPRTAFLFFLVLGTGLFVEAPLAVTEAKPAGSPAAVRDP